METRQRRSVADRFERVTAAYAAVRGGLGKDQLKPPVAPRPVLDPLPDQQWQSVQDVLRDLGLAEVPDSTSPATPITVHRPNVAPRAPAPAPPPPMAPMPWPATVKEALDTVWVALATTAPRPAITADEVQRHLLAANYTTEQLAQLFAETATVMLGAALDNARAAHVEDPPPAPPPPLPQPQPQQQQQQQQQQQHEEPEQPPRASGDSTARMSVKERAWRVTALALLRKMPLPTEPVRTL